jgi:hypothetical protein
MRWLWEWAKFGSLTLAQQVRWRLTDAEVGNGAKLGSLTLVPFQELGSDWLGFAFIDYVLKDWKDATIELC